MTKKQIKEWLLEYAWNGTPEAQANEVACIMSQDDWKYLDARAEQIRSYSSGEPDDLLISDADGLAMSALYECHSEPHLVTCPCYRPN